MVSVTSKGCWNGAILDYYSITLLYIHNELNLSELEECVLKYCFECELAKGQVTTKGVCQANIPIKSKFQRQK